MTQKCKPFASEGEFCKQNITKKTKRVGLFPEKSTKGLVEQHLWATHQHSVPGLLSSAKGTLLRSYTVAVGFWSGVCFQIAVSLVRFFTEKGGEADCLFASFSRGERQAPARLAEKNISRAACLESHVGKLAAERGIKSKYLFAFVFFGHKINDFGM